MAKNESKESVSTGIDFDALLGEKSVKVATTRYFYKPASCAAKPLVGFLVGVESGEHDSFGEYKTLIVRTTQPTLVAGEDDQVKEAPIGSEVMIVAVHELQGLVNIAQNAKSIIKVAILPTHQEMIDSKLKKNMWHFDVRRGETLYSRAEIAPETIVERLVAPAVGAGDSHALPENI